MPLTSRTLVLSDGGLPSLLACVVAREAVAVSAGTKGAVALETPLVLPFPAALGAQRTEVIRRQADLLAMGIVEFELPHLAGSVGEQESHGLLSAAFAAASNKCDLVIWPESAALGENLDLDRIAQIADRALLVGRLAAVDSKEHGVASIRIETPFADLTDRQIADLALDMAAPIEACWWWSSSPAQPSKPPADQERSRWLAALEAVGWFPAATVPGGNPRR